MLSPVTERQFDRVKERYPTATLDLLPSGAGLLTIPDVALPSGWNAPTTTIRFMVPNGYPGPCPDCFWADCGLRLANGALPQKSAEQTIPQTQTRVLWFSWHVVEAAKNWNPNRDDLLTYVGVVLDRMRQPR
jgi:hypothetical protein